MVEDSPSIYCVIHTQPTNSGGSAMCTKMNEADWTLSLEVFRACLPARGANGYVLTMAGFRVYVSGDTEDIPEMRALQNIDLAFVCMNLPFTMTAEAAASAVAEFKPSTSILTTTAAAKAALRTRRRLRPWSMAPRRYSWSTGIRATRISEAGTIAALRSLREKFLGPKDPRAPSSSRATAHRLGSPRL